MTIIPMIIGPCDPVRRFLLEFLEHKLPLHTAIRFRLHLHFCPVCKRYLARYHESVSLTQAFLNDPPPPELVDLTLKFLEGQGIPMPHAHGEPHSSH